MLEFQSLQFRVLLETLPHKQFARPCPLAKRPRERLDRYLLEPRCVTTWDRVAIHAIKDTPAVLARLPFAAFTPVGGEEKCNLN
jgi:hypothetical protein